MRGSLAASFFLLFFLLASRECRSYENHGHRRNLGSRVAGEDGAELFCVADDGSRISTDIEISTTAEATQFTEDVLRCPGADFRVKWEGTVVLNQPLRLNNGTSVTITGSSATSTDDTGEISQVNGGGLTQLFALNGSALHLKRLALTGGKASEGGVVAAHNQASVTIDDCEVYYNTATNMGGVFFMEKSKLVIGGTNFTANNADVFGGAIYAVLSSTISTRDGTENIFHGNTAKFGGAVFLEKRSSLKFGAGATTMSNNSASLEGGAISMEDTCELLTSGNTSFRSNRAGNDGGAIFAKVSSTVATAGNTTFQNNKATSYGGAVVVSHHSMFLADGDTSFVRNSAQKDGGAVEAEEESSVRLVGGTLFMNNFAGGTGGAINGFDGGKISMKTDNRFTGNTALFGGAINAKLMSSLSLKGKLMFDHNTATNDGGAIHASFTEVSIKGNPSFFSNSARGGSGGALYCASVSSLLVKNAHFVGNFAVWGGGVATFSSGSQLASTSATSQSSSPPSLPTTTDTSSSLAGPTSSSTDWSNLTSRPTLETPSMYTNCNFRGNNASQEGGGLYSVAGYDIVTRSNFSKNVADTAGGAISHNGVLSQISRTILEGNQAGSEGPAIVKFGQIKSMTNVVFVNNTFYCPSGEFSTKIPAKPQECRFTTVCARCDSGCNGELEGGATVENSTYIPECERVPDGATSLSPGGTVATLKISPGFYRPSDTSTNIKECFLDKACKGGEFVENYCASGYTGPYCAVCDGTHAPGYSYACKSCIGDSKDRAVAAVTIFLGIIALCVSLIITKLVSVVDTPRVEAKSTVPSLWQRILGVWHERVRKKFPLTAVKIVVVVWQIITQYSNLSGVKYPRAYQDFLSVVDVVNLDFGFMLSFACVYNTDFYDRLLIVTLGPLAVLSVLGLTYMIARRRNRYCGEEAMAIVKNRHLSIALFVLFIIYATVSHNVFETFACDDSLDGVKNYLRVDYSLECNTDQHTAYMVYAIFMVVVYPIGIPCIFIWWLSRHRHELLSKEHREKNLELRPATDLWEPYKRDKYYYEVVECFRRITLTGFSVFIYPNSSAQIAIVLLLASFFMVLSEVLSPFARTVEMWLYRAGNYVVFASMYLALLLRIDVSDEPQQSQEVFSGVIIIAHAAMVLIVFVQGLLIFLGWDSFIETPEALKQLDRKHSDRNDEQGLSDEEKNDLNRLRGENFGTAGGVVWGQQRTTAFPDPLMQKKSREKQWEVWERPAPTAKSSFFPSPSLKERRASETDSAIFWSAPSEHAGHLVQKGDEVVLRVRSLSPRRWYPAVELGAGLTDNSAVVVTRTGSVGDSGDDSGGGCGGGGGGDDDAPPPAAATVISFSGSISPGAGGMTSPTAPTSTENIEGKAERDRDGIDGASLHAAMDFIPSREKSLSPERIIASGVQPSLYQSPDNRKQLPSYKAGLAGSRAGTATRQMVISGPRSALYDESTIKHRRQIGSRGEWGTWRASLLWEAEEKSDFSELSSLQAEEERTAAMTRDGRSRRNLLVETLLNNSSVENATEVAGKKAQVSLEVVPEEQKVVAGFTPTNVARFSGRSSTRVDAQGDISANQHRPTVSTLSKPVDTTSHEGFFATSSLGVPRTTGRYKAGSPHGPRPVSARVAGTKSLVAEPPVMWSNPGFTLPVVGVPRDVAPNTELVSTGITGGKRSPSPLWQEKDWTPSGLPPSTSGVYRDEASARDWSKDKIKSPSNCPPRIGTTRGDDHLKRWVHQGLAGTQSDSPLQVRKIWSRTACSASAGTVSTTVLPTRSDRYADYDSDIVQGRKNKDDKVEKGIPSSRLKRPPAEERKSNRGRTMQRKRKELLLIESAARVSPVSPSKGKGGNKKTIESRSSCSAAQVVESPVAEQPKKVRPQSLQGGGHIRNRSQRTSGGNSSRSKGVGPQLAAETLHSSSGVTSSWGIPNNVPVDWDPAPGEPRADIKENEREEARNRWALRYPSIRRNTTSEF